MDTDTKIRAARRLDVAQLTDLRIAYLAEMARLEPRLQLLADVRERTDHTLPVWIEQEDRVLLVADAPVGPEGPTRLVGYATGVSRIWPPVLRSQHVGEVAELYVLPDERGKGIGRRLLQDLTRTLHDLGSVVLRAPVAIENQDSLERFRALGYRPVQYVLQRCLEEG